MQEFLEERSLEQILADLRTSYQRRPGPALAEMIEKVLAEIARRDASRQVDEPVQPGDRSTMRKLSAA